MLIRPMEPADWPAVAEIYREGIATEHATFQTACPPYRAWDASHIRECRLVILAPDGAIAGWAVLSRVNMRWCYRGVAEVSIYVGERYRGRGYGCHLLSALCAAAEAGRLLDAAVHRLLQDNEAQLPAAPQMRLPGGGPPGADRPGLPRPLAGHLADGSAAAPPMSPPGYKKL